MKMNTKIVERVLQEEMVRDTVKGQYSYNSVHYESQVV